MPQVGSKHFPYTPAGYAAARKARRKPQDARTKLRHLRGSMKREKVFHG